MECRKDMNIKHCNCTYEPCSRKGICCECIKFHLAKKELPACCFPPNVEKTFDRSFSSFIECWK